MSLANVMGGGFTPELRPGLGWPQAPRGAAPKLSPRYRELRQQAGLRKAASSWQSLARPAREREKVVSPGLEERESWGRTVFGPPVAFRLGEQMVGLRPAWPSDMTWEGAASPGAAALVNIPPLGSSPLSKEEPQETSSSSQAFLHRAFGLLAPIAAIALSIITGFFLSFWLSKSLGSLIDAPLEVQDYFLYSLRNFITFTTMDTVPINSLGRILATMEGVFGIFIMLWFVIRVGQLSKR